MIHHTLTQPKTNSPQVLTVIPGNGQETTETTVIKNITLDQSINQSEED